MRDYALNVSISVMGSDPIAVDPIAVLPQFQIAALKFFLAAFVIPIEVKHLAFIQCVRINCGLRSRPDNANRPKKKIHETEHSLNRIVSSAKRQIEVSKTRQ